MKKLIWIIIIVIIVVGGYLAFRSPKTNVEVTPTPEPTASTTTTVVPPVDKTKTVIGKSAGGRDIVAYHYGTGESEVLFVGGIHGGYEWNTALVAYQAMDYFKNNSSSIPTNVKVTVIPVLNPDGLNKVTTSEGPFLATDITASQDTQVAGRFNGNTVDLNRNFDCDWKADAVWQNKKVSGGTAAFSEPEAQAIKSYVEAHKLTAAVVWYSSAGGVFASNCHNGVLPETSAITRIYGDASKYPASQSFDFYEITGDMVNWLAKEDVPAISVLLTNHTDTEWTKNQAGIDALLKHYAK